MAKRCKRSADHAAAVRRAAYLGCCTGAQHGAGPARKGRSAALPWWLREQRIADLDSRFNDTSTQLASAIANGESLAQSVVTHKQEISDRARQAGRAAA